MELPRGGAPGHGGDTMKKVLIIFIVPYLALMAVVFYIFFGPGIIAGYEPLEWQGIRTVVPSGFNVKTYQSKGWEVYSLKKITVLLKIALIPAGSVNVMELAKKAGKVRFLEKDAPDAVYYMANRHKQFVVVFARRLPEVTLYFSVESGSVYSARTMLEKVISDCTYDGEKVDPLLPSMPLSAYWTDLIFLGGMTLPIVIIIFVFYFSGRKPKDSHFAGDPLRYGETFVYYSLSRKLNRKSSFCYLALTQTRLVVFTFMKKAWEFPLHERPAGMSLTIEGKKIVVRMEKEKIVLKPSDIEQWKEVLVPYLSS